MIKRLNIMTKKTFIYNGAEKVSWNNVGNLIAFDNGYSIELSMYPETKFYVFEQKDKAVTPEKIEKTKISGTDIDYPTGDINPELIPF